MERNIQNNFFNQNKIYSKCNNTFFCHKNSTKKKYIFLFLDIGIKITQLNLYLIQCETP